MWLIKRRKTKKVFFGGVGVDYHSVYMHAEWDLGKFVTNVITLNVDNVGC